MKRKFFVSFIIALFSFGGCFSYGKIEKNSEIKSFAGTVFNVNQIYGTWKPGNIIGYTRVYAMDEEKYSKFKRLNRCFCYSAERVLVSEKDLRHPFYSLSQHPEEDFDKMFGFSIHKLGVSERFFTMINISRQDRTEWNYPGLKIFFINKNKAFTLWDGAFFELIKVEK